MGDFSGVRRYMATSNKKSQSKATAAKSGAKPAPKTAASTAAKPASKTSAEKAAAKPAAKPAPKIDAAAKTSPKVAATAKATKTGAAPKSRGKKAEIPPPPPPYVSAFVVGNKVTHTTFGEGKVLAVDGDQLTIKFASAEKVILDAFIKAGPKG
jgi:hypothetical protein